MKIGLDLRFLSENLYSRFIIELVKNLILIDNDDIYNIYLNKDIEIENNNILNARKNIVNIEEWSYNEQTKFLNILKKDDNHIMLFFNQNKPIFYKRDYILLINSLKNIYYQDFSSYLKRLKYFSYLKISVRNAKKIICLDENTWNELVERLNIEENKINILKPFFPNIDKLNQSSDIKIDIRTKNNIKNDFIIYSGWSWIQKNLDRLISVMKKINSSEKKVDLVVLWDIIAKDVDLRNLVIRNELQNQVHFLWNISTKEKRNYYKQSIWVIFPSLYESFPFSLNEAITFKSPIISSNYKSIVNIFWNSIKYFSPISESDILKEINDFIWKKQKANYEELLQNYSLENSTKEFLDILKKYN